MFIMTFTKALKVFNKYLIYFEELYRLNELLLEKATKYFNHTIFSRHTNGAHFDSDLKQN